LQSEQIGAVVGPATGGVVRLARQEGREVHLLCADGIHFFPDDLLDALEHPHAERQPRVATGSRTSDVSGTHQQAVAWYLGLGWVVTQCAHKERRQAMNHAERRLVPGAIMDTSFYSQHECRPQRRGSPPTPFFDSCNDWGG